MGMPFLACGGLMIINIYHATGYLDERVTLDKRYRQRYMKYFLKPFWLTGFFIAISFVPPLIKLPFYLMKNYPSAVYPVIGVMVLIQMIWLFKNLWANYKMGNFIFDELCERIASLNAKLSKTVRSN